MAKHKREAKGKKINPTFFIFCEGPSEAEYIKFLRTKYRVPVEIFTKVLRNKISSRKINEGIKDSPQHEKDKIYLMYDIDVDGFLLKLEALQKQTNSELLVSNPCLELWYILHYTNNTAMITSDVCCRKLKDLCRDYKKGELSSRLKEKLTDRHSEAIKKAKGQKLYENPSTNIYLLIEELEKVKK